MSSARASTIHFPFPCVDPLGDGPHFSSVFLPVPVASSCRTSSALPAMSSPCRPPSSSRPRASSSPSSASAAPSGQAVADVIRAVIEPMLRTPTLREQMHAFVIAFAAKRSSTRHNCWIPIDAVRATATSPLLQAMLVPRTNALQSYMAHHPNVPLAFEVDDDTSIATELRAITDFLRLHQYSTADELGRLGVSARIATAFAAEVVRPDSMCSDDCVALWNASRVAAGRPPVSFGVWSEMYDVLWNVVHRVRKSRVTSLTKEERKAALAEALSRKRKRTWDEEEKE